MTKPRKPPTVKTAPAKITLSASRDIPLDKLVLAKDNVRRLKGGQSIEELAEDIAWRTLLQSLSVRPILDEAGAETGRYEIPAGGRRFRALQLLVQQKRLAKDTPIPCIVRADGLAEEDSLAENVHREALHPLDQYRAFAELRNKGLGEEEIAARFFVTVAVVRQRLKLAAASPKLLDLYAESALTLEQLMAFCVSDDHTRQEQVWDAVQRGYSKEPYLIRRMLLEDTVEVSDQRVVFVGLDAYTEAGGTVLRDLFQQDRGGWLQDVALLESLVQAKLEAEAERVRAEGWRWVTVAAEFPYGQTAGLRRIVGTAVDLTTEEAVAQAARQAEYDALVAAHDEADELPDAVDARLGKLEVELEAFADRPLAYDPGEQATAGAFVSLDGYGGLRVERGYVRREDEPVGAADADGLTRSASADGRAEGKRDTKASASDAADGPRPLPDQLTAELTAYRTLVLQDALANDPDTAFLALLHALSYALCRQGPGAGCLDLQARRVRFAAPPAGLAQTPSALAMDARQAQWQARLPDDPATRWAFLAGLGAADRMALFAHCVALTVNAVEEPWNPQPQRLADADRLADAVGLDLGAAGWIPTVETYLGRVTKAQILEAVREAKGEAAAQLVDHLKKPDMAREAERLLAGTGWLPAPLRRPEVTAAMPEALPAFLAEDDAAAEVDAEPGAYSIAAE